MDELLSFDDILANNNLTGEQKKQAIEARSNKYMADLDRQKWLDIGRGGLGSVISGYSFHPVLNIPYVGTGLGGAMYEAGQAITEGKKLPEIAKRAGTGFFIGETVGAIPYVGKGANKLSGGKIGNVVNKGLEKVNPLIDKVKTLPAVQKIEDALNIDVNPKTLLEQYQARQDYKNLGVKSPKFKEFYEDAKLYDENNNPLELYHGTPRGGFDAFDLAKSGESNSNEAKLGVWFGDTPHIAENFANNTWWGKNPQIYKAYANLKKPKVYEINKEENALLLQNLENARTQTELDLINNYKPFTQGVVFENFDNWYLDDKKAQRELVKDLTGLSDKLMYYKKNGYTPDSVQYKFGLENEFENNFRGVIPEKQQEFINYIEQNRDKIEAIRNIRNDIHYMPNDSYGAFLNDIDKFNTKRPHGLKDHWGANPEDIQNYKQDLINQGYDGIVIKNTTADAEESGLPYLNQYVVFDPKQIKSVNNSGMFDTSINNLYDNNLKRGTDKSLYDYLLNDSVLTKGYRDNKANIDKFFGALTTKFPSIKHYKNPTENFRLPNLNDADLKLLGKEQKPVVIKPNIVIKNKTNHPELDINDYNGILENGLYNAKYLLNTEPIKKPNYYNFIAPRNGYNDHVLIELNVTKDNYEIVGWHIISDKGLKAKIKNANKNGGQSIITDR